MNGLEDHGPLATINTVLFYVTDQSPLKEADRNNYTSGPVARLTCQDSENAEDNDANMQEEWACVRGQDGCICA
jgi:hypothetical protein